MNLQLIPKDSILVDWLTLGKYMEAPHSYMAAVFLSSLSSVLKRNVYFDLGESGRITPNLSIILIGPPGIGKDTSINLAQRRLLAEFMPGHRIHGTTSEGIARNLYEVHKILKEDNTCGYILAGEMKAMFGGKDYQGGMIELLTDLLSDGEEYVCATKHNPFRIPNPTIVLQAGSTVDWFHKLPDGALEGGFIPRCLVVNEERARQMLPLPNDNVDYEDRQAQANALRKVWERFEQITEDFTYPREVTMDGDAKEYYSNWYCNRYQLLGPFAQGYAHRSRGHVARLAMLMAITRGRMIITQPDVEFAVGWMTELVGKFEGILVPPTEEGRVIVALKSLCKARPYLPAEAIMILRPKFSAKQVKSAAEAMLVTGELTMNGNNWVGV